MAMTDGMGCAFILLFLYASYLSIEKYVHTGRLLEWRGKRKTSPASPLQEAPEADKPDVDILGKSLYRMRQFPDTENGETQTETTGSPAFGIKEELGIPDPFGRLESEDIPERYEITGYVERPDPHRPKGVSFDDMDLLSKIMDGGQSSEAEQSHARQTLKRLDGTNMERILQASVLGSDEKLKRYMRLYVDSGEEPTLLVKKDRESIVRDFDIAEFIP